MRAGAPPTGAALAAARAVLAELGLEGVSVEAGGHDGSIALLGMPPAAADLLGDPAAAEVAKRLKQLGFRYVAIDLGPDRRGDG